MEPAEYIQDTDCEWRLPPGGTVEVTRREPAIWTLAHRGYSGNRALDVWAYPNEEEAMRAGAVLAVGCMESSGDPTGQRLLDEGKYAETMAWYEENMKEWALLRVQPVFFVQPAAASV